MDQAANLTAKESQLTVIELELKKHSQSESKVTWHTSN